MTQFPVSATYNCVWDECGTIRVPDGIRLGVRVASRDMSPAD